MNIQRVLAGSALGAVLVAATMACDSTRAERHVEGGDPDRGSDMIEHYGCGSCHTIPGIRDADGKVGPPLDNFAERSFVAGRLPNSARNLVDWIQYPQRIEPGTAMPDMGVTEEDARDIAAYLYTLR